MNRQFLEKLSVPLVILMLATPALSQQNDKDRIAELEARTVWLTDQLNELRRELELARQNAEFEDEQLKAELAEVTDATQRISAKPDDGALSVTHLAGYASADYIVPDGGDSAFSANFNPMFHYLYGNRLLWESELAIELGQDGETEVELEYSTLDIFLSDNLVLVAGKFLSPVGNFRQNLHPSWINKLASAPPGFGHDGAAPAADVGLQLRGGVGVFDNAKMTYAAYIGNGPELIGEDGEIHAVETEGLASDPDGRKVVGGRISFLPLPKLEFGLSGAFGDVAVVENDDLEFVGDPRRNYEVLGVDASYQWNALDLRGEYIMQDVANAESSVAPEGGKWESWYLQSGYKFGEAKWEGVVRYTDFSSPHSDESQKQWAFGLNYLLSPNAIIKATYEFNDGLLGEQTDNDRLLLQMAYGY